MTIPPWHPQLRHTPIKRILTALQDLSEAGHPLTPTPLDTIRTKGNNLPGETTKWARTEKQRILTAISRLATQAETKLGDPATPSQPQPRCHKCGRKQSHTPTKFCPHCGITNA